MVISEMISTDLALQYHLGFDSWWLLEMRSEKRSEFKLLIAWKASTIWMNLVKVIFVINDPITYWKSIRSFGGSVLRYVQCYKTFFIAIHLMRKEMKMKMEGIVAHSTNKGHWKRKAPNLKIKIPRQRNRSEKVFIAFANRAK